MFDFFEVFVCVFMFVISDILKEVKGIFTDIFVVGVIKVLTYDLFMNDILYVEYLFDLKMVLVYLLLFILLWICVFGCMGIKMKFFIEFD